MKVAINGAGIAGPAFAWWLRHYGHEPVLFEKAPALRTGGYMIDFWGTGYDVAEQMGLIPALREKAYFIEILRILNRRGRRIATLSVEPLRDMLRNRFFSIARSDLAATIVHACGNVEIHFDDSIAAIEETPDGVEVRTLRGHAGRYDLVVGADGVHSAVRQIVFGPEAQFEKRLGLSIAAFTLDGYRPRDELAYVSHTVPQRQAARVALRDDKTMFLFIWRNALSPRQAGLSPRETLRHVFGDMQWEVPAILARLDETDDFYADAVTQIRMQSWSRGRVVLLGDAGACVSFLAGEGTGLAMTEARVLASELQRARNDIPTALAAYERSLRPLLTRRQKGALGLASSFAPQNALQLFLRDMALRASAIPGVTRLIMKRLVRDDFTLPPLEP